MLRFVSDKGSKVLSNNAVPGNSKPLVQLLLDHGRNVLFQGKLLYRLQGSVSVSKSTTINQNHLQLTELNNGLLHGLFLS